MLLLKQPKGLWILAFGNLWDTFSYLGTQTLILLYVMYVFHFTKDQGLLIYGAYAAFAFSLPTLGGIVADRYIGSRRAILIGGVLAVVGNLVLMCSCKSLFSWGIALTLVGSGLYKSNSTRLAGSAYKVSSKEKESGYLWFYLAINVGGALGPLVYGYLVHLYGWQYGFLSSAVGIFIGYVWFLSNYSIFPSESPRKFNGVYVYIFSVCALLFLVFYFVDYINVVVTLLFVAAISYIFYCVYSSKGQSRSSLFALLILFFFALFYFAAGLQIGSSIALLMKREISQGYLSFKLPASTFSSLYCIFVLILVPLYSWFWATLRSLNIEMRVPTRLSLGMFLASMGIFIFAWASFVNAPLLGIIFGVLFLSAGELAIGPSMFTLISDVAPQSMQSTMMGGWFLFIALGGYVGALVDLGHASLTHNFTEIGLFALVVSVVLFSVRKLIIQMIRF